MLSFGDYIGRVICVGDTPHIVQQSAIPARVPSAATRVASLATAMAITPPQEERVEHVGRLPSMRRQHNARSGSVARCVSLMSFDDIFLRIFDRYIDAVDGQPTAETSPPQT